MILDKTFPPDPRVENEAIELIKAGHEVFLWCLSYHKNQTTEATINGISVKRYKSNQFEYKTSALTYTVPVYSFLMKPKIARFLNDFNIDAIHVHDMVIADAVFKANKKLQLPVILDLHENRPEIMKFYPHLKKFPSNILISLKKWKQKEQYLINKADKLIVITQEAKNDVLQRCTINSKNIVLVPNTVRTSFYNNYNHQKTNNTYFNILYIGDTGDRRGLKTVIKSIASLHKTIKNIQFTIVGKITNDLKKCVAENNVEKYVDFQGWQKESTFQKYISNSDVCVSPLHRNIHHDTTYANKIFQYMSFGKPLLVSNATAQQKIVEKANAGLVHEEKNVIDFSNKVLTLYQDQQLRNTLGNNGKSFVQNNFTWDKTAKDLVHLYNHL